MSTIGDLQTALAPQLTITFRAKLDHFAGGHGYKVPALTQRHVSVDRRDVLTTTIVDAIGTVSADMTRARLRKYAGLNLPGVVWADGADSLGNESDPRWVITPRGNGYMADVTIVVPLQR